MLARLDQELDPTRAAVNREGTLLRLESVPARGEETIKERVLSVVAEMGFIAERLSSPVSEEARWYSRDEVSELSAEEARVLTERWLAEMIDEGLIGQDDERKVRSALESILLACFLEAARTGKVELDLEPLSESMGLDTTEIGAIRDWLSRKLGG
ncbi:MAG: hypothetical protein ACRDI1_03875 [Actinomycetota bacterium]